MKLLNRTGHYFLRFSLVLLFLGGLVLFGTLSWMLNHELDEGLVDSRRFIRAELTRMDTFYLDFIPLEGLVELTELPTDEEYAFYQDTIRMVFDEEDGIMEEEPVRQYIFTERIRGQNYRFTLERLKVENEDLVLTISGVFCGFMVLLLLMMNFFNRYISRRLWEPFYYTIDQIRNFNVAKGERIGRLFTDIDEFKTLARAIDKTTQQLIQEYHSLKAFTENASHEIQTPLAIIQAKTDLLLQGARLDESSANHLQDLQQAANRLSRLSKSLLLLVKIENRQFGQLQRIGIDEVVADKLAIFTPLFDEKSLKTEQSLEPLSIRANPELVDILVRNLLNNALKYTPRNGTVELRTTANQLRIRNTGEPTGLQPDQLFERFQKGGSSQQSLGLGLAIAKEICLLYHWQIEYSYEDGWHSLLVSVSGH